MTRLLVAIHLIGNALLLWLGYYWLGLAESRASTLAWSAAVALLILAGACWLHGSAFASVHGALRNLPWTVLVAVAALTAYLALPVGRGWWIARWIVLPMLLVPLFTGAAVHGLHAWRGYRNPLRWVVTPLFVFAAVWIPMRLLAWVPRMAGFGMEMTSFILRAGVAYLLFVAGWLAL